MRRDDGDVNVDLGVFGGYILTGAADDPSVSQSVFTITEKAPIRTALN